MDKHVFAKFGVFVLLGMNVGAFFVFWPHQSGNARSDEKALKKEEKGEAKLVPTPPAPAAPKAKPSAEPKPKPKELAAKPVADATPLKPPESPKPPEKKLAAEDVVGKLLSRIKEQNEESKEKPTITLIPSPMPMPKAHEEKKLEIPELPLAPPPMPKAQEKKLELPGLPAELAPPPMPKTQEEKKLELPELPAAPMVPGDGKPRPLPPLKGEPVVPAEGDSRSGITTPLTPKAQTELWALTTERAGPQTLMIAKLQVNGRTVEFRIHCDRVESKPGGQEVLALGNVVLTGAGMRVECRRLTLPLKERRLAFEEEVAVAQPGGVLRAELLIWEYPPESLALPK